MINNRRASEMPRCKWLGRTARLTRARFAWGFDNGVEAEVLAGLTEGELVVGGIPQPPMPDQQFGRGVYLGF